jgi:hypothetical protein
MEPREETVEVVTPGPAVRLCSVLKFSISVTIVTCACA